ncbi:DUF4440 domain-containing protein [Scandinavium goeteborgense]|uniref:DUF4440 domain-containing protein n=1 Tax=Scandinavium goeteborgense TaxID=1851514 RepID=UPI002165B071|nr:DUF4440 domain-containing protein [Scandinavium goeteborgense]MCS2152477.1 DUF4440 domain-containing protein [Scandinavium goeteborgense]
MNPWINEIIDAHTAIEDCLGRDEGDIEALISRFSHDFTMVTPGGASLDYAALCQLFQTQGGKRAGLKIVVENIELLAEWTAGAALRYTEKQTLPGQATTTRWSTVIFQRQGEKIIWRHLHETAQA